MDMILHQLGLHHLRNTTSLEIVSLSEEDFKKKHAAALTVLDKDVDLKWAQQLQLMDVSARDIAWVNEVVPGVWQLRALWLHSAGSAFDANRTFSAVMLSKDYMTQVSRSSKKTASSTELALNKGSAKMWTAGLTCPLNDSHLPGRFKSEKESSSGTSLTNDAFSSLATAWYKIMPNQAMKHAYGYCPTDMLLAGKGMTNYSLTVDYQNKYHIDENDAPGSCIFWFEKVCQKSSFNGMFQLPSIGVMMKPSHSSFLYLDTSSMVHGTAPGSSSVGNLHGVAFYCKPSVVSRIRLINTKIRARADDDIKRNILHRKDFMSKQ